MTTTTQLRNQLKTSKQKDKLASQKVLAANSGVLARTLLESATTAIILLDADLGIGYLNPAAENMLQTSAHRLLNQPIEDFPGISDSELIQAFKDALISHQPFTQRELQWQITAEHTINLDITVTPISVNQSLLEPSQAPAELAPKKSHHLLLELQGLDRFIKISKEESLWSTHQASKALIRGLAHEVKNPLGGIRGAAQLLSKEIKDSEYADYTQIIMDEADRLRDLVDRMLGPRLPPKLKKVNIHEVLERVKSLVDAETAFSIKISRDYDTSLPDIDADLNQTIQAVLNILRNAVQAIKEQQVNHKKQTPEEAVKETVLPQIKLITRVSRQQTINNIRYPLAVRITVEDNGPGIPAELIETLFYPLVSGRAAGTGLGLAIAQAIFQQHNGIIECNSAPGCTQFHLFLPLESK